MSLDTTIELEERKDQSNNSSFTSSTLHPDCHIPIPFCLFFSFQVRNRNRSPFRVIHWLGSFFWSRLSSVQNLFLLLVSVFFDCCNIVGNCSISFMCYFYLFIKGKRGFFYFQVLPGSGGHWRHNFKTI